MKKKKKSNISQPGRSPPSKTPMKVREPATIIDDRWSWRFSEVDTGGPFPWKKLDAKLLQTIQDRLGAFEKLNLAQLKDAHCHPVEFDDLSQDAQKRLKKLKRDDVEELWSFRVSGKQRMWAIGYDTAFHLLWWDPNHKVCPSEKRHT
jgi:hypothetical protein